MTPNQQPPRTAPPRVLLVEDDPISRSFLGAALAGVPAEVDAADSLAAGIALASSQDYALWMIDARLPDGSGSQLLARLREQHPHTPALAHTAAHESTILDALLAAGFGEVLVKPMPASTVQSAVQRMLGLSGAQSRNLAVADDGPLPLWDYDAAARALNGNRTHVDTLRGLFALELPKSLQAIAEAGARGDGDAMRGDLHRLRASCGFVGALRLAAAVEALHREPGSQTLLHAFELAARETQDSL
ncbi:response regulator [Lysobacter sp. S4-A87]|uniref:Hpt domain-containing response regulator n=1 Tax=Lysobacter sp. S4-A87 TaxID=2925843 RepID=UPI001F538198|nr:response regulator [Lysobacter sp. S4-A87]UNK50389.1 response regulator [Lysobacter sp. S4-A87]